MFVQVALALRVHHVKSIQNAQNRSAFSFVEVLVVLAVIGLLTSLIVPAVMDARDSARKLDCQNRLRQFGLAIHQFESTFHHLPVGVEFDLKTGRSSRWMSPQTQFLPFLEQASLFEEIKAADDNNTFQLVVQKLLPVFHCPSESITFGINYRVCTGRNVAFHDEAFSKGELAHGQGAFAGVSSVTPISFADITDGLSNTAAMSERSISLGPDRRYDRNRDIWYSNAMSVGFDPDRRPVDDTVAICRSLDGNPTAYFTPYVGHNFVKDGFMHSGYNHVLSPNSEISDCLLDRIKTANPGQLSSHSSDWGAVAARSQHRDRTVSLLLLDGSVKLIAAQVDLTTWRALGSRKDAD